MNLSYLLASNQLLCEIIDSGPGIKEEMQSKIFESFTQAEMSTTRRYGGTGLGLSICSKLVQLMEGRISVESEEGNGSRFFFTLPIFELSGDDAGTDGV